MSGSRVVHATTDGWAEVEPKPYKDGTGPFRGVVRHTLLGGRESDSELSFEVRYFEVSPGGYSSLERHAHPHAVLVAKGRGKVRLGDRVESVAPMDVVYVAPGDVHRFEATDEEPLGFVCVVDRERDRPEIVEEQAVRGGQEPR